MSKLTLKMDLWKVEKDGALRVQLVPTRESQGQAVAPLRQQPLLSRRMRQLLYRWAQCSASWPYLEWNCWPVLAGLFWRRRLEKWALRSLAKKRLKRITKVWHDFFLRGTLSNFVQLKISMAGTKFLFVFIVFRPSVVFCDGTSGKN